MSLRPGMKVLDVGCGVGGPAREIARFSDVNITGLNNNDFQIMRARKYTKQAGLEGQVNFAKGDFMKLVEQFGENSFDAGESFEVLPVICKLIALQSTLLKRPAMLHHGRVFTTRSAEC